MMRCPRRLATLVGFDYEAASLWPTQTCNSLGSGLLQVMLIKLVKLHVQYGKLSMDCALVEESSLEGWYKNGVYIFFSISCIFCIAKKKKNKKQTKKTHLFIGRPGGSVG